MTARPSQQSSFRTVLVVDDDPQFRKMMVRFLALRTCIVVREASSALGARTILENEPVHLICSDYLMPGGFSGTELLDEVGRRWPHVCRVLLSGYTEPEWVADRDYLVLHKGMASPRAVADMLVALARSDVQ